MKIYTEEEVKASKEKAEETRTNNKKLGILSKAKQKKLDAEEKYMD
jgi:hypothetical protein